MSLPDAAASAAIDGDVAKPVWFAFCDFVGDPVRANSSGIDLTLAGTGQPDLDGSYVGISHRFVSVSPVKLAPGGSDSVLIRLSGLRGIDDADRAMLADPANWQGRIVRLWRMIRDQADVQQGGLQHYYTGYMLALSHNGSPASLTLELTCETYLAAFAQAAGLTLMDQGSFDEQDLSPRATIALANGNGATPLASAPAPVIAPDFQMGPFG